MSTQHDFYLERAREARTSAGAATLDNVRDRWLHAEARWTDMAARSERGDKMRAELVIRKTEEQAASEAAAGR